MQVCESGSVALHCRLDGAPHLPTLVFSNSLGTDLRVWDALLPHLPTGLRLLRYDKRGHGLSALPPGPWSMADHVGDLAALLDALGISDAIICGLSVGGQIAQGLAAQRPDLARALILMDTAAKIGTPDIWNERLDSIREGGIEAEADPIMQRWFTRAFREGNPSFALWRNMLTRTPVEGYLRTGEAIRDTDFSAPTSALTLPVLGIGGDEDGSTPPDLVRATTEMVPGGRFVLIGQAGHLPCVEQPEATGAAIRAFLTEIGIA